MLVLLTLTASTRSLAQETETCYSPIQVSRINDFRKDCEKCQLDLEETTFALNACAVRVNAGTAFWQTPEFLLVTGLLIFGSGFAIGNSH